MRSLFLISFLALLAISLASHRPVATFEVNLNVDPAFRWTDSIEYILDTYGWDYSFKPVFANRNATMFNKLPDPLGTMKRLGELIDQNWPEYAAELRGIASTFQLAGHYVSYEYLAIWAYVHEIGHLPMMHRRRFRECTGIVARTTNNTIIQGRNMDQSPQVYIRNLTLHHVWKQNGAVLFESVDWYWFTAGPVTAFKAGVGAAQSNWRIKAVDLDTMMQQFEKGAPPQSWWFRLMFLDSAVTSFDAMVDYSKNVLTAAPCYVVLSGMQGNDGAIVSRDVTDTLPFFQLDANTWFLVETNYDHWEPDPDYDQRRTFGEYMMKTLGQATATQPAILFSNVMDRDSIHNEGTIYTCVMNAHDNVLQCVAQTS